MDAGHRRFALLPIIQCVAEHSEGGRLFGPLQFNFLFAVRGDQPKAPALEGEKTIAARYSKAAIRGNPVRPRIREHVAEFQRAQDTALGAQQDGGIVLNRLAQSAAADLRTRDLGFFAGQEPKHVEAVRP